MTCGTIGSASWLPADSEPGPWRAFGSFLTVDGRTEQAPAPRFSGTPAAPPVPAPIFGQHTEEVLAELGLET